MKKLLIVVFTVLLSMGCTKETDIKKDIVSKINMQINSAPAAVGASDVLLEVMNSSKAVGTKFQYPERDIDGWTILTPSNDSRLIYVSSSDGDDAQGQIYSTEDVLDPVNPVGVHAFKSIVKAMRLLRDGYPDWLLLKKGDEWVINYSVEVKGIGGRSMNEPRVFTAYGEKEKRPVIKTGVKKGFKAFGGQSFISIVGLKFYAHTRNPESKEFVGWGNTGNSSGFISLTSTGRESKSILIEDSVFDFYASNIVVTGKGKSTNMVVRRNQILNAYSEKGHGQGLFITTASLLLEENLLDHNGWYQQQYIGRNSKLEGQATMFNHNAYLPKLRDSIISNNIITRASSQGLKFTANPDKVLATNTIEGSNIVIEDNLIIEGEVGIGIGGNTDFGDGPRWKGINILNNVLLNIGGAMPTARNLAFNITTDDWDGGSIIGNYILFNDNSNITNVIGISVSGASREVVINSNVMYGLHAFDENKIMYLKNNEGLKDLTVYGNYTDNSYNSDFTHFRKDIRSYMQELGEEASLDAFILGVKQQSKSAWDPNYTTDVVNMYLKSQFK